MSNMIPHAGRRARRDLAKEHFWRKTLGELVETGGSVRAFCKARGLSEPSLYAWRKTLRQRPAMLTHQPRHPLPSFLPVNLTTADASTIEIVLGGDRRIRLHGPVDRVALADVLAVVTSTSSVESE
jgi:hypothetical protein